MRGREGEAWGGEEEQKSKILPEDLTPQLDTEPAAFRLTQIASGQICGYSSRSSQRLVYTVRALPRDREPLSECPFFVVSE